MSTIAAQRFEIGQWVVLRGKALGRVTAIADDEIVVAKADLEPGEESTFAVPTASAAEQLRPMVTASDARALIERLGAARPAADDRPVADRSLAYRRASKRGDLAEQVETLAAIYRHPEPAYPERQYQGILEKVVFPELAHATGRSRKAIKADVRAAALGQRRPASLALPDRAAELAAATPPPLAGHQPLGAFAIDTRVAIGEARPEVTLDARPGIWFAYTLGDMDGEGRYELVAVHAAVAGEALALRAGAAEVGSAVADGARMAVFDAAEADDEELADEVLPRGDGIVGERCAIVSIGGDGRFPVLAAHRRGKAVLVAVAFHLPDARPGRRGRAGPCLALNPGGPPPAAPSSRRT